MADVHEIRIAREALRTADAALARATKEAARYHRLLARERERAERAVARERERFEREMARRK